MSWKKAVAVACGYVAGSVVLIAAVTASAVMAGEAKIGLFSATGVALTAMVGLVRWLWNLTPGGPQGGVPS